MNYNIRDKWLALAIYRNPVEQGQHYNVTGNTKWKVCGSKSIASKYCNMWIRESDTAGEYTLINRVLQCKDIGTMIKDYGIYNGKDAIRVVNELKGVANQLVSMASELGVKF
jgi:hypothetical protein